MIKIEMSVLSPIANRILLSVLICFSALGPWSARASERSKRNAFCESALSFTYKTIDKIREIRDDKIYEFWRMIRVVSPETGAWFDVFFRTKKNSTAYASSYNDRPWNDPVKVAHAINRSKWHLDALITAVLPEEYRAEHNYRSLKWELWNLEARTPWMKHFLRQEHPKYLAHTYEQRDIDEIVTPDFPNFSKDPELRVVEIIVAPLLLFEDGRRLPRAYWRHTLIVMRRNLVEKSYPTLDIQPTGSQVDELKTRISAP